MDTVKLDLQNAFTTGTLRSYITVTVLCSKQHSDWKNGSRAMPIVVVSSLLVQMHSNKWQNRKKEPWIPLAESLEVLEFVEIKKLEMPCF